MVLKETSVLQQKISQLKIELQVAFDTGNLHSTDYLILVNSATIVQETLVQLLTKINC